MKKWLLIEVTDEDINNERIVLAKVTKSDSLTTDSAIGYLIEQ